MNITNQTVQTNLRCSDQEDEIKVLSAIEYYKLTGKNWHTTQELDPRMQAASSHHPSLLLQQETVGDTQIGFGLRADDIIEQGARLSPYRDKVIDHIPTNVKNYYGGNFSTGGWVLSVDSNETAGAGVNINHGIPNCTVIPNKDGIPTFMALRKIEKGEFIHWDYGSTYQIYDDGETIREAFDIPALKYIANELLELKLMMMKYGEK